jgi:hypothetical protein
MDGNREPFYGNKKIELTRPQITSRKAIDAEIWQHAIP